MKGKRKMTKTMRSRGRRLLAWMLTLIVVLAGVPFFPGNGVSYGVQSDAAAVAAGDTLTYTIPEGQDNAGRPLYFEVQADGTLWLAAAFEEGSSSRSLYQSYTGLIKIPASVQGIPVTGVGAEVLMNCNSINGVEIPEGVATIGEGAFSQTGLKGTVELPRRLTTIGVGAFSSCPSLIQMTIPESVTSMGKNVFRGNTGMKGVYASAGATVSDTLLRGGASCPVYRNKPGSTIEYYVIKNGEEVANLSFYVKEEQSITLSQIKSCSLTDLEVPGVVAFGRVTGVNSSLWGGANLTSITFPKSMVVFPEKLFENMQKLEQITFLGKLENMELVASTLFENGPVDVLTDIYLSDFSDSRIISDRIDINHFQIAVHYGIAGAVSVTGSALEGQTLRADVNQVKPAAARRELSYQWFRNGSAIPGAVSSTYTVTAQDAGQQFDVDVLGGESYGGVLSTRTEGPGTEITYTIPEGQDNAGKTLSFELQSDTLKLIHCGQWSSTYLTGHLQIPEAVEGIPVGAIGPEALRGYGITSVEIPQSVTRIGAAAFEGCTGLKSVKIPRGVATIGGTAFAYCAGLTSVVIAETVTEMAESTFAECTNLENVAILGENLDISSETGQPAFWQSSRVNLYLPKTSALTDDRLITAGQGVVHRGVEGTVTVSGMANPMQTLTANVDEIRPAEVRDRLTYQWYRGETPIGGAVNPTYDLTMEDAEQGVKVKVSGDESYGGSIVSEAVTVSSRVVFIIDDIQYNNGKPLYFEEQADGTLWLVSNSVGGQSEYASYDGDLDIPKEVNGVAVSGIAPGTFRGCNLLWHVYLPSENLVTIGEGAFQDCSELYGTLTIPAAVTYIGAEAFAGCEKLSQVIMNGLGPDFDPSPDNGKNAFSGCTSLTSFRLSEACPIQDSVLKTGNTAVVYRGIEGSVTVRGMAQPGQTLNAYTEGIVPSFLWNNLVYQWYRDGASIEGANGQEYTLTPADGGKQITAAASGGGGYGGNIVSAAVTPNQIYIIPEEEDNAGQSVYLKELSDETLEMIAPSGKTSYQDLAGHFKFPSEVDGRRVSTIGVSVGKNVTSVEIPDSITTIRSGAFSGCAGLTDVVVPASVTTIGEEAFNFCNLTSATILGANLDTSGRNGRLLFNNNYTTLKDLYVAEGCTISDERLMEGCVNATVHRGILGAASVTGAAVAGQTLTVNVDAIQPAAIQDSLAYQWYRGETPIDGANASTYAAVTADVGQEIKAQVSGADYGGIVISAAVTIEAPPGVTVSGYVESGRSVTLALMQGDSVVATTAAIDGQFRFETIEAGNYILKISAPSALTRTIEFVVADTDYEVSTSQKVIDLIYGDADGDGQIGLGDLATVRKMFGVVSGSDKYSDELDADGDGQIGLGDLATVRKRFGSSSNSYTIWSK